MNCFYCSLHFCFRLTGYNSQPACYWLVSALVFCDHGDLTEVLQCLEEEFQQQLEEQERHYGHYLVAALAADRSRATPSRY